MTCLTLNRLQSLRVGRETSNQTKIHPMTCLILNRPQSLWVGREISNQTKKVEVDQQKWKSTL